MDDTSRWKQINIEFADWTTAEPTAVTHIAPLLLQAEEDALITGWFFLRKAPCWRVRYLPGADPDATEQHFQAQLRALADTERITGFQTVIYEPETRAFGGTAAMQAAQHLFHRDSRHLLAYLATTTHQARHRRELAVLLCCALLRGADLDWYEQGDVWAHVAEHRPPDDQLPPARLDALEPAVRRLLSVDTTPLLADGGTLAHAAAWIDAFAALGHQLAHLAATGRLHRGVRAVLAHHVVFTWNRHGLPYPAQVLLAHTAQRVVFGPDPATARQQTQGTTS
ncbi:thiopeptide-type bacteriocin biosynthesis protein [Spirillospora sp. CA-128828]|uniref:thiopeptide-type bacteriocin biosynthesis protein n=1 Tax=Spirillospora sp. CA-128828 TaxID=3240033 RepID=UPI003D8E629E